MSRLSDQDYLREQQYKDDSNLNARIQLHQKFSTNRYGFQRWVFDQLELPAACRILELGAGPGQLWRTNLERVPSGWQVTVTDFSAGMQDVARQHLTSPNFSFQQVDAQALPFPDASFEAVIANHMLYHVPDRPKALAEIRRVLKPGGRLYAATNGEQHMFQLGKLITGVENSSVFKTPANFTLENGAEQLAPYYDKIELRLYEDSLLVTEVEPVLAYVQSAIVLTTTKIEELKAAIAQEITKNGAFQIAKATGLFVAQRAN